VHEYVLHPAPSSPSGIDYEKELNEEQLEAVRTPPGPILVIAGAGSGKTRTLTYRVAYLIEQGISPENILLLTFTNKAAKEMLSRVTALLPHDISRIWGGTFHHIANRLLRSQANRLGYGQDFTIMDRDESKDLAGACIEGAGLDPKDKRLPKGDVLVDIFGLAANKEIPVAQVVRDQYPYFEDVLPQIELLQRTYRDRKKANNVMDYDDLLSNALKVLQDFPDVLERYQRKFQHILVDEYQDTNKIQSDFIDLLAAGHRHLMVVGDDAQSIYSWRGAEVKNILSFPERYVGAKVVRIETNYRSTPEILNLANTAIAGNSLQFKKDLRAIRPAERLPKPALVCLADGNQQASFVAQRVLELREEGTDLRDMAILYRSHFHAMELQMELTRRNIPFQITSGLRFFEQAHIKDVSAFIKLAANPRDELAFKRIAGLWPGVGMKTAEKLWQKFSGGRPLHEIEAPAKAGGAWKQWAETHRQLLDPVLKDRTAQQIQVVIEAVYEDYMKIKFTNYQSRLEDLAQLRSFAEDIPTTSEFLSQLSLLTNNDGATGAGGASTNDDEKLKLSTVHQAKGLEWKVVFVIMLCDGLFPSSRSTENLAGEEEERRLFYVAVTRARDELYLTYPMLRAAAGPQDYWQKPSRFLEELPREITNRWKVSSGTWT
jgi:DNA helicase-2/ATP-dependent DNA helicase PcrA